MEAKIALALGGQPASEAVQLVLDNGRSSRVVGLSAEMVHLETLSITNTGLKSLKGFPALPNLRQLDLSDNRLAGGLAVLKGCTNIATLNLSGNYIRSVKALEPFQKDKKTGQDPFPALRSLDLFNCPITSVGNYRQAVFNLLPQLETIDGLNRQQAAEAGREADGPGDSHLSPMERRILLVQGARLPAEIQELDLEGCQSNRVMGLTVAHVHLRRLVMVNMGLKSLQGFPALPNLESVDLRDNGISGGLGALVQCPAITHLDLAGNRIKTRTALKPLAYLANLRSLDLGMCPITAGRNYRQKVFDWLPQLVTLDGLERHQHPAEEHGGGEVAPDQAIPGEVVNGPQGSSEDEDSDYERPLIDIQRAMAAARAPQAATMEMEAADAQADQPQSPEAQNATFTMEQAPTEADATFDVATPDVSSEPGDGTFVVAEAEEEEANATFDVSPPHAVPLDGTFEVEEDAEVAAERLGAQSVAAAMEMGGLSPAPIPEPWLYWKNHVWTLPNQRRIDVYSPDVQSMGRIREESEPASPALAPSTSTPRPSSTKRRRLWSQVENQPSPKTPRWMTEGFVQIAEPQAAQAEAQEEPMEVDQAEGQEQEQGAAEEQEAAVGPAVQVVEPAAEIPEEPLVLGRLRPRDVVLMQAPAHVCDDCHGEFATARGLKIHASLVHTGEPRRWVQCPDCPRKLRGVRGYKIHAAKVHRRRRGHSAA